MNYKSILEIIELVNSTGLTEVEIQVGDFKLRIFKGVNPVFVGQGEGLVTGTPFVQGVGQQGVVTGEYLASKSEKGVEPIRQSAPEGDLSGYTRIVSPMVGTFYRSPGADREAFVKVGDVVRVGDVVCIIEAMKLFNEIESEVNGRVVEVVGENGQPVEFEQVLFLVEPL